MSSWRRIDDRQAIKKMEGIDSIWSGVGQQRFLNNSSRSCSIVPPFHRTVSLAELPEPS